MRKRFTFLVLGLVLIAGCRSPQLERTDFPIMWGLRVQDSNDLEKFDRNLTYPDLGKEIALEMAVKTHDSLMPSIDTLGMRQIASQWKAHQMRYNLAVTSMFDPELFSSQPITDTLAWFQALDSSLTLALQTLGEVQSPERVVVGNDWEQLEGASQHWEQLFGGLQQKFPNIKFGYGFHGKRESPPSWIRHCDFFALEYPPHASENPKPFAIQNNPRMGAWAEEMGLPLYIYRSNVMGLHKTIGLKNRLRFWPESLKIEGLATNTLYPKIAPLDSTSYYGALKDGEYLAYWSSIHNHE